MSLIKELPKLAEKAPLEMYFTVKVLPLCTSHNQDLFKKSCIDDNALQELHLQPFKYIFGYYKVSFSFPCTIDHDHAKELHYSLDFSNSSCTC